MRHKLICFEGIDGSGKTTLAKAFAKKIGAVYYYSPSKFLRPFRFIADTCPPIFRYYFYSFGNHITDWELKRLLRNNDVVCDRYIYSTVVYHEVLLNRKLKIQNMALPDKIIYVSADWDVVKKRLPERKVKSRHERFDFLIKVKKKYDKLFSKMKNVIRIDTSKKSVDDIVKYLIKKCDYS